MKKLLLVVLALFLVSSLTTIASATNGDNLIGIGAISRSMGGVGVAAPQDAISATFGNPAGMCFGPYCPGAEVNFDGTLFMPNIDAKITLPTPGGPFEVKGESDDKVYAIPAIGLSVPITNELRFGLSAYGVSGLGVDYRDELDLDPSTTPEKEGDIFTQLQILKFSPNLAYLINDKLSVGLGIHVDYSQLDLGEGTSFGYGVGAQVGVIYKVIEAVSLGATYISEQSVNHDNVADLDRDGDLDLVSASSALPAPGVYYLENLGDGRFVDQTASVGDKIGDRGNPCAVMWSDYNNDGFSDLHQSAFR